MKDTLDLKGKSYGQIIYMKIAILQSNYLPWTGVFELINSVDKFVFLDVMNLAKHIGNKSTRFCNTLRLQTSVFDVDGSKCT